VLERKGERYERCKEKGKRMMRGEDNKIKNFLLNYIGSFPLVNMQYFLKMSTVQIT
jgi:hypothetical protein